ncbi:hypothetical protein QTO34_007873 [Cnephaeus nilssonii]|uniref:Uncharacterized protein n=1 Tax=Cnephaeus nilssonii TaxID=3371016 RepID=A0AA40HJV9_CNENI|nr:hypothetical protein QTO34_007873 [Eptesicus nilssonii]
MQWGDTVPYGMVCCGHGVCQLLAVQSPPKGRPARPEASRCGDAPPDERPLARSLCGCPVPGPGSAAGQLGAAHLPQDRGRVWLGACGYMIDNVILLLSGALQKKSVRDLLGRCHPLGRFSEMEAVNIAETPSDLFHAVLVETPLGTSVGAALAAVCGAAIGKRAPRPRAPVSTAQWRGARSGGTEEVQPSPPASAQTGSTCGHLGHRRREGALISNAPALCPTQQKLDRPRPLSSHPFPGCG